jgi:hypothetical protein
MPESVLRLKLQRGYSATSLGRFKVMFSEEIDQEIVEHVRNIDNVSCCSTAKQLHALVFHFAHKNISFSFDTSKEM